jgi:hypothetical protein
MLRSSDGLEDAPVVALTFITGLWLLGGPPQAPQQAPAEALQIFANGRTGKEFPGRGRRATRAEDRKCSARGRCSVARRASPTREHRLVSLIVAEDWCPDSVNTVTYVNRLAELAGVELRIRQSADESRSHVEGWRNTWLIS